MKIKDFEELSKKFLTDEERHSAKLNAQIKFQMMLEISEKIKKEMEAEQVGFNELVKHMRTSPAHLTHILNGNANLTIGSLARVCTALNIEPHIVFKKVS
jgi:hydroxymethylpyrimidine pyrophosphatase-like HAD family hydrolase